MARRGRRQREADERTERICRERGIQMSMMRASMQATVFTIGRHVVGDDQAIGDAIIAYIEAKRR